MTYNKKLLLIAASAVLLYLVASYAANGHILIHTAYVLAGSVAGLLLGRCWTAPKLKSTRFLLHTCSASSANKMDGSSCTVVAMKQYCYIVNTPTPHQICFWVKEEYQGKWNSASGCCEAIVDGRRVCVRPAGPMAK